MKGVFYICVIFMALIFLPLSAFSFEKVDSYEVFVSINNDSSINITENIVYDFGSNLRRGIYREIDTVYREGKTNYRLEISNIEVFDQLGNEHVFEVLEGRRSLRIDIGGDTPRFSGAHNFIIRYKVEAALVHQENYDALHWDVTGFDWGVSINNPGVVVELPELIEANLIDSRCYVGLPGSKEGCSINNFNSTGSVPTSLPPIEGGSSGGSSVSRVVYGHHGNLGNGRGMTVDLRFPKGFVEEAEPVEVPPLPWVLFLILALGTLLPIYGLFVVYGRGSDPEGRRVIVRQYDVPPGVTPSDAGVVLDRRFRDKELVAELISLAIRGYIKIVAGKKKFIFFPISGFLFLKLKPEIDLPGSEKKIMESIFDPKFTISRYEAENYLLGNENQNIKKDIGSASQISLASKFRGHFHKHLKEIKNKAKEETLKSGYFDKSFKDGRWDSSLAGLKYFGISALIIAATVFVAIFAFPDRFIDMFVAALLLSGFVIFFLIFILSMMVSVRSPRRTKKGAELKRHMLGLKNYIEVAEKERMDFHFDPKSNPDLFEKLLPFAVVLGLEKRWTAHLRDLNYTPDWYASTSSRTFSSGDLRALSRGLSSSSGSGSGGSGSGVGGGMGGGGGGSR